MIRSDVPFMSDSRHISNRRETNTASVSFWTKCMTGTHSVKMVPVSSYVIPESDSD